MAEYYQRLADQSRSWSRCSKASGHALRVRLL